MKLIVCRGIPGSGKSTWARKQAHDNPDTIVRVCRDDIRNMLGKYWVPDREGLVTQIEDAAIYHAIERSYDVIVDATNIGDKAVRRFAYIGHRYNVAVQFKDFDTDVEECIRRDALREAPVGEKIIRDFHKRLTT
jgi:predicted kinase